MPVIRRKHIPYNYVTYTGKVLADCQVDDYNRIQNDINIWIDAGRPVPEWLLDWSHQYFVTVAAINTPHDPECRGRIMRAGKDKIQALEQAKANAKQDNRPRYVWVWANDYWIDTIAPNLSVVGPYEEVLPDGTTKTYGPVT